MVLNRPFHCPTRVIQGRPFDEALAELLDGRTWTLVTSAGWEPRGSIKTLMDRCGAPSAVLADVRSNPDVPAVIRIAEALPEVDIVVALGGGSVIDAAKGGVAYKALAGDNKAFLAHLRDGDLLPEALRPMPIVAVPTTSGTGSEVTCWGTLWGEDRVKHSISHPRLYPSHAVLDPALCVTMSKELTVITGLDALSHAMESVWNRRHTEATDAMAEQAIRMLSRNLKAVIAMPADVRLRGRIQTAALLSGLTMGTTQTAAAHSISYPFTSHFGVPHGLACGFPLAEVARFNIEADPERLAPIADGLGCAVDEIPEFLESWFDELGIGVMLDGYVTPDVVDTLEGNLITRARAANNIRELDEDSARRIASLALDRFCSDDVLPAVANS